MICRAIFDLSPTSDTGSFEAFAYRMAVVGLTDRLTSTI